MNVSKKTHLDHILDVIIRDFHAKAVDHMSEVVKQLTVKKYRRIVMDKDAQQII